MTKYPTSGWMRSELERRGIPNRGTPYTDAQLAKMLRELGVDVSAQPKPAPQTEKESDR